MLRVLLLLAAISAVPAQGQENSKRLPGTAAIANCYSELGYPSGHFNELLKTRKIPSSQGESCFLGCVYRRLGLTRNGSLDVVWAKQVAHILYTRLPDKLARSLVIIDQCGPIVRNIDGECALGFATRRCLVINSDPSFTPVESEVVRLLP